MQPPFSRINKKTILAISLLALVTFLLLMRPEPADNDDSFWKGFLSYFSVSQPEQVVTKEIYQKPEEGTSVAVPIIVYHSVRPSYLGETAAVKRYMSEPTVLDQELSYLRNNDYHVISLDSLLEYFDNGTPIPTKPIVLTFDDGWENQYVYAFPLLKKYGFTATFFIFTSAIGHKNFLTWDQIKEMDTAGMSIGGHTRTHPYLTKITDPTLLKKEIAGGKQVIEEHLGHTIDTFAYPFGMYNATTTRAVSDAGYRIARTSKPGLWHTSKDLLEITAIYDQNSDILFSKFIGVTEGAAKIFEERSTN